MYEELQKLEDCGTLHNLNATPSDCLHIQKLAERFRVKKKHIIRDVDPNHDKINQSYLLLR